MSADRYKYFRIEAREIVDGLAKGLLDLEKHADAELVARLLRLAHTLKGAARIVKHRELAEMSHAIEDALAPLREAPVARRLDDALALVDQMSVLVATLPSAETPKPVAKAAPAPVVVEPMSTMPRVDAAAIDDVLGGLGEVHQIVSRLRAIRDPRELERGLERLDREVRDVRYAVEQLRLLPASSMFASLERTARDAAVAAGKQVVLRGSGGEVRLDGQTLSALHAPLVQLVRNAVVHGIEVPSARGTKPAQGTISIDVRLHGGMASVSCRDDGRGIDYEAVRRAAIKRGITDPLDDSQLLALLLHGGITTSAQLTELSGRGIGLDLVRATAAELGGNVTATTGAAGTEITLTVPASLAAISCLVVESGPRTAAIPLSSVRRVSRLEASTVSRAPGHLSIAYDDIAIPFASLSSLLGGNHQDHPTFLVIEHGGELAGLGVQRTLGVDEVVMRAPPRGVALDPIVRGLALDAEGLPRPVLEPTALIAAIRRTPPASDTPETARALPILVVDDSLTTRMLEQSILESAGYDVELATSGEEALNLLAQHEYGLMLVDVEMPGMDGFSVIAELRSRPETATLPAILVTSRNAPEDLERGVAVGATGYVVKSEFDQVELLALIRNLVRR